MIPLSAKWTKELASQPETGMGYQIASIVLKDGRRFDQVVIDSGFITRVKGMETIPFSEDDIREIILTHDKWDFDKE
jgi:hypothetical protein